MALFQVEGGAKLSGEITVQGSKNAVLPMLAASVLCKESIRIENCPKISDVLGMISLLEGIGCDIHWEDKAIVINPAVINSVRIMESHARVMRSSIILAGSMLGREKNVLISYPGGCSIGARPINLHLNAFRKMNVEVEEKEEWITLKTSQLTGCEHVLDFPSVGATENIILAGVLAEGVTVIYNAAKEPEIKELCHFLCSMGAEIAGAGTEKIVIRGVKKLHGTTYQAPSDRIVFGTYLAAVTGTGGEIHIDGACAGDLGEVFDIYQKMGVLLVNTETGVYVKASGKVKKVDLIRTRPYPGFPTDMQSQTMAVLTKAKGTSIIIENLFEGRFKTVPELKKMGAGIYVDGRAAVIHGVNTLHGASVSASDLRGGAALIIAGLMAEGMTTVSNIQYIERGYEDIAGTMQKLGAHILRIS